jgi:hypothetical protein
MIQNKLSTVNNEQFNNLEFDNRSIFISSGCKINKLWLRIIQQKIKFKFSKLFIYFKKNLLQFLIPLLVFIKEIVKRNRVVHWIFRQLNTWTSVVRVFFNWPTTRGLDDPYWELNSTTPSTPQNSTLPKS